MTLQDVFASGVSGDAFRTFYALQSEGGEFTRGIGGLAEVLGWSDRKTSRVLKELETANIVRVERRYKAPARICVRGVTDGSIGSAEPAPGNRSDGLRGSCSDSDLDSVCTVQNSQSESEVFDLPDLSGQRSALAEEADPYNLRPRLQAVSFIGTEWLLKTFSAEVIDGHLTVVEDLVSDGIAHNPGGLLNCALRGKCVLFRPEKASETSQETSKQEVPTQDAGDQVKALGAYVEQLKAEHAERYPMDVGMFTAPDTYHQEAPDETYADPVIGIEKLKAGLTGRKVA